MDGWSSYPAFFKTCSTMSEITTPANPAEEHAKTVLDAILVNFRPAGEITEDSLTTQEIAQIVSSHMGPVSDNTIYNCMLKSGYRFKFSFARNDIVWMMEFV